jgi:peptidoglycan hydrolase-like protein with peptidoglycan-binding domain
LAEAKRGTSSPANVLPSTRRYAVPDQPEPNEMSFYELQNRLRDLGYYDGPFEAPPSSAALAALERFQRDHGLPITRRPDSATVDALRESICY